MYDYWSRKLQSFWQKRKWWIASALFLLVAGGVVERFFLSPAPQSPAEKLNQNIAAYIQAFSHDPKSYEPIETTFADTLYLNQRVLCYYALHRCRLKNALGALTLNQYYVQADSNLNLLKFEEKFSDLYREEQLPFAKPIAIPK